MRDFARSAVASRRDGWLPRAAVCVLGVLGFVWAWTSAVVHVAPSSFVVSPLHLQAPSPEAGASAPVPPGEPVFLERYVSAGETASVHASSAHAGIDSGMTAYWFGGSREGAADVSIYSAQLSGDAWAPPEVVVERQQVATALSRSIRKLGNATVHRHADGRLWLFFVSVSYGGWAGSALNLIQSTDDGATWSVPRRLVTSPFLNVSTLVRGSAVSRSDGSVLLPVYHEFVGKFGELLHLAPDGRVLSKTRLSTGRAALQPEIVIVRPDHAIALMRSSDEPRRVLQVATADGGRTWSPPAATTLPNPDAALDALPLQGGRLLVAFNDSEKGRERLVLASTDALGREWRRLVVLEDRARPDRGFAPPEHSYPWLMRDRAGTYHVFYTWNRERIKHVSFDQRWLDDAETAASSRRLARRTPPPPPTNALVTPP